MYVIPLRGLRLVVTLALSCALLRAGPIYNVLSGTVSYNLPGSVSFTLNGPAVSLVGGDADPGVLSGYDTFAGLPYSPILPIAPSGLGGGGGTVGGTLYSGIGLAGGLVGPTAPFVIAIGAVDPTIRTTGIWNGPISGCLPDCSSSPPIFSLDLSPTVGILTLSFVGPDPFSGYTLASAVFTTVPEPLTGSMLFTGLGCLVLVGRRLLIGGTPIGGGPLR